MTDTLYYNEHAEQSVLGAIFLEPDCFKDLRIKPDQFYSKGNSFIFEKMMQLDEKREPIDLVTVVTEIGDALESAGGFDYLSDLANCIPSASNVKYYENIVLEKWRNRVAVESSRELQKKIESGDKLDESMAELVSKLMNLSRVDHDDDGSISDAMTNVYRDLEEPKGELTGIDTGFHELNRLLRGFQLQDLVIIAARPSIGKTAFALNVLNSAAQDDMVAVFSLEMNKESLLKRMLSIEGNILSDKLRTGDLSYEDWGKLTTAFGLISNKNIRIFDKAGINTNYIWSKVAKLKRENPGKRILVMIDYLQLIVGAKHHKGNRQAEIGEISRTLKEMARELNVCVCALSQLSRGVESRQDKRPMMSDIRESGQIEQDADVIGFLYRDDYYDKETENKNIIEIIIAKQRNGAIGSVQLAFVKEYGKFLNLERRYDG